ncbi:hypothetical protein EOD41_06535 [Mucilaginibacter limnophilus]|uniref:Uncharacterized protein n=1 Tax=Mucilaginibacter limnophilus TaxID=1932778 RepID=A0A437MVG7_9SPHI|nr:hypothetical protein [Mucilaginibacter limnophilus]RVU01616.1 hypothetical protein EOD41_06535 [Mucilaginibacter limnophilus]
MMFVSACQQGPKTHDQKVAEGLLSFEKFFNIHYTEVYRRQANGLVFNEYGYQLEPQWRINFVSNDSVSIFSPKKQRFLNFALSRGYDSIFNTARVWFKARKMTKDSLLLEILEPHGDSLDINGAKVYLTFYADSYIKNVLHTDAETLQRPSRNDTLYIKKLIAASDTNLQKAFAGREPVEFISRSANATAKPIETEPTIFNMYNPEDYLNPAYNITIKKAYMNFFYTFTVIVDKSGELHYGKPLVPFTDEKSKEAYIRTSKAIMDGYLKTYFAIIPGKTLSLPHASEVTVNITGIK